MRQAAGSLQYAVFAVTSQLGDPTTYPVLVAFTATTTLAPETWNTAAWVTEAPVTVPAGTYLLQCLIGPGGTIELARGQYTAWVTITANPEAPVLQAGTYTIF